MVSYSEVPPFDAAPKVGKDINPVRKSSTFQRKGAHGALNPVFAEKGATIIPAASRRAF
jgi:hypothetical protein